MTAGSLAALSLAIGAASAGEAGFDHTHRAFDAFLDGAVTLEGVRYGVLADRRAQLDAYLAVLGSAPVDAMTRDQKVALITTDEVIAAVKQVTYR